MKTFKRYAMTFSPASLLAGSLALNSMAIEIVFLGILSAFWFNIELIIASWQEYHDIVPASPWLAVSRVLWLPGAAFAFVDAVHGMTVLNYPLIVKLIFNSIILIALLIRIIAYVQLGKYFTYDVRISVDQRLVTGGLYSIIRHPAYLSICLLGTLPALVLGSAAGFALLVVTTVPQTVHRICEEERLLEEKFGDEFRRYKEKTWRMVPLVY